MKRAKPLEGVFGSRKEPVTGWLKRSKTGKGEGFSISAYENRRKVKSETRRQPSPTGRRSIIITRPPIAGSLYKKEAPVSGDLFHDSFITAS
jgi:hypothetical protein